MAKSGFYQDSLDYDAIDSSEFVGPPGPTGPAGPTGLTGPTGADVNTTAAIEFVIDGGGLTLTTGIKGYLVMPFSATINRAALYADVAGSIVVDVFKCTHSAFDGGSTHPVAADKITASAPPTISASTKSSDSLLTGWTTALAAGDVLGFNVNSVSAIKRVTLTLEVTRT